MTDKTGKRPHLTLVPPTMIADVTERERLTSLLRRTADAVGAPHSLGEGLWKGEPDSLTAMAAWSTLNALISVMEAEHVGDEEVRSTCHQATSALHVALLF